MRRLRLRWATEALADTRFDMGRFRNIRYPSETAALERRAAKLERRVARLSRSAVSGEQAQPPRCQAQLPGALVGNLTPCALDRGHGGEHAPWYGVGEQR